MLWGQRSAPVVFTFLFLILLAPALRAQWSWSVSETELYVWAALSVGIAATFLGLAYMAGKLFGLQLLDAWVKLELHELVTSMVILVFCVALIASVNASAQFLSGESGATNIIDSARLFLANSDPAAGTESVYEDGRDLYRRLGTAYFNTAKISSYSYTAGAGVSGYASTSVSESPASGLSPLVADIGQAMDSTSNFMLLAASQSAFLKFFGTAAAVMLPVAIFLRCFSFTRKIGGTLLAAVIAASVIYPAAFFVSKEVYDVYSPNLRIKVSNIRVEAAGNPPAADVVCNPWMQQFLVSPIPMAGELGWQLSICLPGCAGPWFAACYNICTKVVRVVYIVIKALFPIQMFQFALEPYGSDMKPDELVKDYYDPLKEWALPAAAEFSVLSLAVFLIPLIITMVMLRNLAITFGGEPQLYGISKLV